MSLKLPGQPAGGDQGVKDGDPGSVPVAGKRIDREHARGLAHAHDMLAGQQPVNVTGQGGEPGDPGNVGLALEDRLVQVGDAPALGHAEVQRGRQFGTGLPGVRVAPRPERHEELAGRIQGQIAVHHPADPDGGDPLQPRPMAHLNVLGKRGKRVGQAGPNVRHVVGPQPVAELVLPGMGA